VQHDVRNARTTANSDDRAAAATITRCARRWRLLDDYIEQLRDLGARLSKEYADNAGALDELKKTKDQIDAAGEMIVKIELANVKPII
jgi:hypothetical protein